MLLHEKICAILIFFCLFCFFDSFNVFLFCFFLLFLLIRQRISQRAARTSLENQLCPFSRGFVPEFLTLAPRGGGGTLIFGSGHFWGFKIVNFNILGGFRKMNIFGV